MASFKKLMSDYGLGVIIILLLSAFAVSTLADYINNKALGGSEGNANLGSSASAYKDAPAPGPESAPSNDEGAGDFASVSGESSAPAPITNPADLLPKDSNNEFASMAPTANGGNNAALLDAGHHIGSSGSDAPLRNANLQLRGEEPNPRSYNGPWNQSTIEPDTGRKGICA